LQSGDADFSLGRTDAAIQKIEKAVALDPDLPGGHAELTEFLWRTGKTERAEGQLRAALQMDPYDASAYNLMGRVLTGEGQAAESLFDFEKATRLRPGYAPHLYDYALELSAVGRLDEARLAVDAALEADPDFAEAHELSGGLLAGKRQLAEAAMNTKRRFNLNPSSRAHLDLARVLADQGDIPGAIEHLRKAAAGSDPTVARLATQALQRVGK
jgi:tetratricopeptide (TPR) repeat protein